MNKTTILEMDEQSGTITKTAVYSLPVKSALIAYYEQEVKKNWNTWEYPQDMPGIRESAKAANVLYLDAVKNGIPIIIQARNN